MHKSVWKATYLSDGSGYLWGGTGAPKRRVGKGVFDFFHLK